MVAIELKGTSQRIANHQVAETEVRANPLGNRTRHARPDIEAPGPTRPCVRVAGASYVRHKISQASRDSSLHRQIEYMQRFFIPVRDFSTKYAVMQSAMSSAERIFELLDQPVPIASPAHPVVPATIRGRSVFEIAAEVLKLARAGLTRRNRLDQSGHNETRYLEVLEARLARKTTPAQELLDKFKGPWRGSVDPIYADEAY